MNNLVVLSTVLLGFAYAYDFGDESFNQLLAGEYDDFSSESSFLHPRARRDDDASKCHHRHRFCCADDLMSELHDKYRDVKKECYKEVTGKEFGGGPPFTCEELEKRKKDMICIAECAGKKKGVLNSEGNLIEDEAKKFLKEAVSSLDWFQPKLDEVFDKCVSEAKHAAEKSEKGACNPSDLKFAFCIFKEIQLACPADQIKEQDRCDAVREGMRKHDFPPPH